MHIQKAKRVRKKGDFHIWIWLVRLRRIREKSIKEAATIRFIPTELEDHSYLDMYTQHSNFVHTNTLSLLSTYNAPLSQKVKEKMIPGGFNLFDSKEIKRLTSNSPHPAENQECSWALTNTCCLSLPLSSFRTSTTLWFTPDPNLTLLKQNPPHLYLWYKGFSIHTYYVKEVHIPFKVLFKSSINTQIKLLSPFCYFASLFSFLSPFSVPIYLLLINVSQNNTILD